MRKIPATHQTNQDWLMTGPMGPEVPSSLKELPCIAVDGGIGFHTNPLIWIGDGDSGIFPHHVTHTFLFPQAKDQSDLACALSLFADHSVKTLHLWGFFGGRLDHFLANIGEIQSFLLTQNDCTVYLYNNEGKCSLQAFAPGDYRLQRQGNFSLFSFHGAQVSLKGDCDYPIPDPRELPILSSLGLSNVAHGSIQLTSNKPCFMVFEDKV